MLASAIRELIAPVLRQCPPACGIVAITRVEVSPDQSWATVYVSALREAEEAMGFLQGQKGGLRRKLSSLGLRSLPQLRFRIDRTGEEAERIDRLLGGA